jgi:ABC-type bacteriocin/lantibiotic exporter with double-glycine peptidase domain
MPENSTVKRPRSFRYAQQITDSHCGPAVIEMLLNHAGVDVTQEQITQAAGVADSIEQYGTRIDQLASAVRALAPHCQLWVKHPAELEDLIRLVKKYDLPVGVEWQGLFDNPDEILSDEDSEDDEDEYGHYSVVSHVDETQGQLTIVDPYKDYVEQDRVFPLDVFYRRWWDTNLITDPVTGQGRWEEDLRLLFVITPASDTFPLNELGMTAL